MHTELQSIMKQAHMLSKISLLAFAVLAFLSGCSSEPTSTIEIPSDGTTSISINGNQFQVREGNVTYNGQKIAVPEIPHSRLLTITNLCSFMQMISLCMKNSEVRIEK
jgi:uncharacterized lipoprotein YajG